MFESRKNEFCVSTDKSKLDIQAIYDFLSNQAHWAKQIPYSTVERSIENSLCFGVYESDYLIGFARVVSDYATFAWVADVFIVENRRGRGFGKWLMECIINHPDLSGLRRWILATRNAHGFYEKFGFKPIKKIESFMEIYFPEIYERQK